MTGRAGQPAGPLRGLRVLELAGGVAGPYAGRLLAMLGADVVKLEPERGDACRRIRIDDRALEGSSPLYVHLNAGKRSALASRIELERALRWAQVVIVDRVRDQLRGTALDPRLLERDGAPRVLVTVTAWGFDADEPGEPCDELLVQAASGLLAASTGPDGCPQRFPGWQSQYLAGVHCALGAMAVLGESRFHWVDVSWVDAMRTGVEMQASVALHEEREPERARRPHPEEGSPERRRRLLGDSYPSGVFRCADGSVVPGTVRPIDWAVQAELYGLTEEQRERWLAPQGRIAEKEGVRAAIAPWYASRSRREIFELALERDWALGMVLGAGDALECPHLRDREFFTNVEDGSGATIARLPGRLWFGCPREADGVTIADVGADTAAFSEEVERLPQSLAPLRGARLEELRVLELTWAWAGPSVGRFLGLFGSDVVRVESGRWPDAWRTRLRWKDVGVQAPPGLCDEDVTRDASPLFNGLNRSKRGISIDLTTARGQELFRELLVRADALVVNMGQHVLERLGLQAAIHAAAQDRLVVVDMPLLGASGRYRRMPGYGSLVEAMGGFASRYGPADEQAAVSTTYYPDAVAGLHATLALLAGLAQRERTGKGQYIDFSQQESLWMQLGEAIVLSSRQRREPDRMGNAEPGQCPSGVYPTSDGCALAIVIASDREWASLAQLVGAPLAPFAALQHEARCGLRARIEPTLGAWMRSRDAQTLLGSLRAAQLRVRRVESWSALDSAAVETLRHPATGVRRYLRCPLRIDGKALSSSRAAPLFSEHTAAVLEGWLRLDAEQIQAALATGAAGTLPSLRPAR